MIYVDSNQPCVPNSVWKWDTVSHLFCDGDLDELHGFAEDLGLRRSWFQPSDRPDLKPFQRAHYDLTPRVRKMALKKGAMKAGRDDVARWLGRDDLVRGGCNEPGTGGRAAEGASQR